MNYECKNPFTSFSGRKFNYDEVIGSDVYDNLVNSERLNFRTLYDEVDDDDDFSDSLFVSDAIINAIPDALNSDISVDTDFGGGGGFDGGGATGDF